MIISFLEVALREKEGNPVPHNAFMVDSPKNPSPFPAALVRGRQGFEGKPFGSSRFAENICQRSRGAALVGGPWKGWLPGEELTFPPGLTLCGGQHICSVFDASHPQHAAEKASIV